MAEPPQTSGGRADLPLLLLRETVVRAVRVARKAQVRVPVFRLENVRTLTGPKGVRSAPRR